MKNAHSCYNLLTTSIRIEGEEITNDNVHEQVKMASAYAKKRGMQIALDMDVRLARRAFEAKYPDELQKLLRLHKVDLSTHDTVETVVCSIDLNDHMTDGMTHYIHLSASLLRAYSYMETENGIDWWVATRDWAQTDEDAPFCVRTSLSKKWNSPVCYNQFYASDRKIYQDELWSSVLAGGRINYHPLYRSHKGNRENHINLFRGNLMQGESKVRLLNFISQSPVDCPVAVIFGHPCAMNWAGPYYEDLGLELANNFWCQGIPTDLIPSSEIENKSIVIDKDGWICYGTQRYSAIVLYHPEFEKRTTAEFFQKASGGKTRMFRIGDWTEDFNGQSFDGNAALPKSMLVPESNSAVLAEINHILKEQKVASQSAAIKSGNQIILPTTGFCRLIDGTVIQVAGSNDVVGDPIFSNFQIKYYDVFFDAIGVAAVRLDNKGNIQALAAGGLKSFKSGDFEINLEQRIDITFWLNNKGKIEGIVQGWTGDIPPQLMAITKNWKRLEVPVPLLE